MARETDGARGRERPKEQRQASAFIRPFLGITVELVCNEQLVATDFVRYSRMFAIGDSTVQGCPVLPATRTTGSILIKQLVYIGIVFRR